MIVPEKENVYSISGLTNEVCGYDSTNGMKVNTILTIKESEGILK